jgi:hypothetical protein
MRFPGKAKVITLGLIDDETIPNFKSITTVEAHPQFDQLQFLTCNSRKVHLGWISTQVYFVVSP